MVNNFPCKVWMISKRPSNEILWETKVLWRVTCLIQFNWSLCICYLPKFPSFQVNRALKKSYQVKLNFVRNPSFRQETSQWTYNICFCSSRLSWYGQCCQQQISVAQSTKHTILCRLQNPSPNLLHQLFKKILNTLTNFSMFRKKS